jgi:endonuclease/exonuclease/phosphatase family metal-dependent hydrolase
MARPANRSQANQLMGVLGLLILFGVMALRSCQKPTQPDVVTTAGPGEYLFCFWNVENLFDDQPEDRPLQPDAPYDRRFSHDPAALHEKLDHLSDALLKLNGGRGPDVLACCEVESVRAAELLAEALNAKLADPALRYTQVVMKEIKSGRHIAPCVISRLPVDANRTQLLDSRLRILRTFVTANGHELVLVASHWTSQLEQRGDGGKGSHGEEGRAKYADQIYGEYKAMYLSNPAIDFLLCGDFNDVPDSPPVAQNLHAVADRSRLPGPPGWPELWDLMGGKSPEQYGTHYHNGPLIYDQFCVSPGMLDDQGWSCEPETVATVTDGLIHPRARSRRPWRFGGEGEKEPGYSDHFPIMVRLKVAG